MGARMEKALRLRVAQKVIVHHTRGFIHGELEENWPHFEIHGEGAFFRFSPVEVSSIVRETPYRAGHWNLMTGPNTEPTPPWYIRLTI